MRDRDSDNEYNEAEDEDYNPIVVNADSASSSEDEAEPDKAQSRKRKEPADEELDSGDEATIKERESHKRRKHDGEYTDESFIRTRAQRQAEIIEAKERKRATTGRVTVDVDLLWAQLNTQSVGRPPALPRLQHGDDEDEEMLDAPPASETITIKRRVKFAGAITEIEEEVARSSKEAQTWLAEQEKENQEVTEEQLDDQVLRPLRRVSKFEPNPLGIVKGVAPEKLRRKAPSRVDMVMAEKRQEEERAKKAEKLSTMRKTQLDWKGFVVEQGLGEELKEYGKSKKGYIAREAFLDQVHVVNEAARRTARLKR